jgi:hypothetical protein
MKSIFKMPIEVHAGFLQACPLASREYEILINSLVRESPMGHTIVEVLCEADDAKLLLEQAANSYSDAVPYIEEALSFA